MREDAIDFYPDEIDYDNDKAEELTKSMSKVCDFDLGPGRVTDMQWNPACIPNCNDYDESPSIGKVTGANLITVQSRNREVCFTTFDVGTSCATHLDQVNLQIPDTRGLMPNPPKASWDPHNHHLCAVTLGTDIAIMDMRTPAKLTNGLRSCHRFGVTDLDYNPNKPNVLSSSGQDGLIKFWDLRFTASYNDENNGNTSSSSWARQSPLRTVRGGHTHWATCVKYNAFHDQLILSGGTDSIVNLWRISSISSAPLIDLVGDSADDDFTPIDDENSHAENPAAESFDNIAEDADSVGTDGGNAPDVRVTKMEMREAIYDLTWSAADPWLFVTLAYDGNVVLNHVPSKEKYKILL
jgi:WD40 repeat protein